MFESPQVNFYVRDVEESARFYQESFGFTETFRTPEHGPPAHAELRLGAFTLGLATIESLRDVHGITADGPGPPRAEVVVWTDDVDLAYAVLAAREVRTLSAPHDFAGSLRAAWVADPDGNPVQMVMRQRQRPALYALGLRGRSAAEATLDGLGDRGTQPVLADQGQARRAMPWGNIQAQNELHKVISGCTVSPWLVDNYQGQLRSILLARGKTRLPRCVARERRPADVTLTA